MAKSHKASAAPGCSSSAAGDSTATPQAALRADQQFPKLTCRSSRSGGSDRRRNRKKCRDRSTGVKRKQGLCSESSRSRQSPLSARPVIDFDGIRWQDLARRVCDTAVKELLVDTYPKLAPEALAVSTKPRAVRGAIPLTD